MEPLPKDKRHLADYRDEIEHAEVAAALSELRSDHPAAVAYSTAAAADSLALTHLLKDRPDIYLFHRHWLWAYTNKLSGLRTVPDGLVRVQGLKMN